MTKPSYYPWSTGQTYRAASANVIYAEMNNLIETAGQTPNDVDNFQTSKSVAQYSSVGDFYKEAAGSAADVYVIEGNSNFQEAYALADGMRVRFRVVNSNTGASTLNFNGLGAKVVEKAGSALVSGDLVAGNIAEVIYVLSTDKWALDSEVSLADLGTMATQDANNVNITGGSIDQQSVTGVGRVVQMVSTSYSAVATGTTLIPLDDTIPQITEGDEYMTQAITPTNSSNLLVIEVVTVCSNNLGTLGTTMALFQDSTANALHAITEYSGAADEPRNLVLRHIMTAGTTSSTTFRIRIGSEAGSSTLTFNGRAGARLFGNIPKSNIRITEIKV